MKLVTIIGARPQFIKSVAFSDVFRKENTEIVIHTGQHYDENMSSIFFYELNLPKPDYNLSIGSESHGKQIGRMIEKIEEILLFEKPDGVLVYGDTNSTIAGALAACKINIPVFHIEAGLRSYNKSMPEEQNRVLTDHISTLLLCPTETAVKNLKIEGITKGVFNTGDIMYDALLRNRNISQEKFSSSNWISELKITNNIVPKLNCKDYYLATIHRAENTDDIEKIKIIFKAFELLDKPVIVPLHPRTRKIIDSLGLFHANTTIVQPVGYLLMLHLTSNAYMVITDSGGLQKEAFLLKVPCTTLRDQTEWIETLENNWNMLSSINVEDILMKCQRELTCIGCDQLEYFGDGNAAKKICEIITRWRNND